MSCKQSHLHHSNRRICTTQHRGKEALVKSIDLSYQDAKFRLFSSPLSSVPRIVGEAFVAELKGSIPEKRSRENSFDPFLFIRDLGPFLLMFTLNQVSVNQTGWSMIQACPSLADVLFPTFYFVRGQYNIQGTKKSCLIICVYVCFVFVYGLTFQT